MFQFFAKNSNGPTPVQVTKVHRFYGGFVPAGTNLERRLLALLNQLNLISRKQLEEALLVFKELAAIQMATNISPRPEGETVDVLRADEAPIYSVDLFLDMLANLDVDREALAEAVKKQEESLNA